MDLEGKLIKQSPEIIRKLNKYCEDFPGFLILSGRAGIGKTEIAKRILEMFNHKFRRKKSIWYREVDLRDHWLSLVRDEDQNLIDFKELLSSVNLLIIDDLGVKDPSDAFLQFLYGVIDKRCSQNSKENKTFMCPTVFTSNLQPSEILAQYGERMASRVHSGLYLKLEGKDWRIHDFSEELK